jgi:NAD(P)-dependent dehydrogenase (short-subunit alcohol dehydrogenase family)
VTGGTGGIAAHVARWLPGRGAPRVVLASRSGPAASGVAALAADLAEAGTAVDVLASDLGERAEVAGLLGWIDGAGPRLSSVLHTAGLVQATMIQDTDAAELAAMLAAKAAGAAYLDDVPGRAGREPAVPGAGRRLDRLGSLARDGHEPGRGR